MTGQLREQIRVGVLGATDTNMTVDQAVDYIVEEMEKLGYRKMPIGEPPMISHEQMMAEIWDLGFGLEGMEGRAPTQKERFVRIAGAQLASDIAFYTGHKPAQETSYEKIPVC